MPTLITSRLAGGALLLGLVAVLGSPAPAVVIESFEGGAGGFTVPANTNGTRFEIKGTGATGATDGTSALVIGPTATNTTSGPDYGQILSSPSSLTNTVALASASQLLFDVTVPAGQFGFFLQFDVDIDNAATGYQSLQGYSYPAATIGGKTTFTGTITPAMAALLAGSGAPTTIIVQAGGGFTAGGTNTFYVDNFRTVLAPEPATLTAVAGLSLLASRRRRG